MMSISYYTDGTNGFFATIHKDGVSHYVKSDAFPLPIRQTTLLDDGRFVVYLKSKEKEFNLYGLDSTGKIVWKAVGPEDKVMKAVHVDRDGKLYAVAWTGEVYMINTLTGELTFAGETRDM